jgi:hypothetical protein
LRKKSAAGTACPIYVVIEGPLAGGHLGFGMDWAQYDLATIVAEIARLDEGRTARHSADCRRRHFHRQRCGRLFLENGAAAVQVATRFTVAKECGLPDDVQAGILQGRRGRHRGQHHLAHRLPDAHAQEQPRHRLGIRPNCEAYGYLLDSKGNCAYITAYNREVALHPDGKNISVMDKTCLCTHMRNFEMLDLRPLHLPPEGHLAAARRRQLPAAERRTHLPRLPVQHRPQDCAAGLTPARAARRSGGEDPGRQIAVAAVADDADDHRVLDRLAMRRATTSAPPDEMPAKMPSSRASRRVISSASPLPTLSTRSTRERS